MADNLTAFMAELEKTGPGSFAAPAIYYGAEEDSLTLYFKPDESYAHRLSDLVTLFLSLDDDHLVGCQVKGLRRKLLSGGNFGVAIRRGGKLELDLFFHLLAYEVPEEEPRNRLVELAQRAKGLEIDTEQLVPC